MGGYYTNEPELSSGNDELREGVGESPWSRAWKFLTEGRAPRGREDTLAPPTAPSGNELKDAFGPPEHEPWSRFYVAPGATADSAGGSSSGATPLAAPNAQALRGLVAGDPSGVYATAARALADAEERKQLDAATLMANAVKTTPIRNREALLGTAQDKIRALKERGGLDLLRQGDLTSMLPGFLRTMRTGNIDDGIGTFEKGLATLTAGERKDVEGKRLLESQFLRDKMLAGDKDFTDVQARNAAELQAKLAGLVGTVRPGAEKEIAKYSADKASKLAEIRAGHENELEKARIMAGAAQGKSPIAIAREYMQMKPEEQAAFAKVQQHFKPDASLPPKAKAELLQAARERYPKNLALAQLVAAYDAGEITDPVQIKQLQKQITEYQK